MIYFLLDEHERRIEIGLTRALNTRLAHRRNASGCNLRLLAVMAGGRREATAIRDRFRLLRCNDGWHRIDKTLTAFIDREGTPWGGGVPDTTPEYRDRLTYLAARSHIPAATLASVALAEWAARHCPVDIRAVRRGAAVVRSTLRGSRNAHSQLVPRPGGIAACEKTTDGEDDADKRRASARSVDAAARTTTAIGAAAAEPNTWSTGDPFADEAFSHDGNSTFSAEERMPVRDVGLPSPRHPYQW